MCVFYACVYRTRPGRPEPDILLAVISLRNLRPSAGSWFPAGGLSYAQSDKLHPRSTKSKEGTMSKVMRVIDAKSFIIGVLSAVIVCMAMGAGSNEKKNPTHTK